MSARCSARVPKLFPPAQPCLYLARVLRSHPSGRLLHSSRIRTRNQALFDPAILLVPSPEAFPEGWSRRIPLSMSKTACGLPLSPPSPVDAAATATRALELSLLQICRTRERNASRPETATNRLILFSTKGETSLFSSSWLATCDCFRNVSRDFSKRSDVTFRK